MKDRLTLMTLINKPKPSVPSQIATLLVALAVAAGMTTFICGPAHAEHDVLDRPMVCTRIGASRCGVLRPAGDDVRNFSVAQKRDHDVLD